MSYEFYKVLHFLGIFTLMASIAVMMCRNVLPEVQAHSGKIIGALHGVSLLVIFIAGFGLLARTGMSFSPWVGLKIALWLGIGLTPIIAKKAGLKPALLTALVLASLAAYVAVTKPLIG